MAKYTMIPGIYAAGDDIPLRGTSLCSSSQFHEPDSPIVQLKGSGNVYSPARYNVAVGATLTATAAAPERMALLQDGTRVTGGMIATVPAAIGDMITVSVPNELAAAGSIKVSVQAVTAVTITEGLVVIHRTA